MMLKDKIAIVTGAAGGLGLASATSFAEHGAKVFICDVTDDKGEAAAQALRDAGHDVQYRHCDVTKKADIQALVDEVVSAHGRLDIMMANAGIVHASDPLELAEEDYDRVMAVNLKGVFLCGQIAGRQMIKQEPDADGQRGVIINMSSCQAVIVIPEIAPYVMSKGGINQWTKALGIRLAPEGIRVNAIGPGSIATEMFKTVSRRRLKRCARSCRAHQWAGPASHRRSALSPCSWPRPCRATSPARPSIPTVAGLG
jgi:glucose 1-dehydrogenase